MKRKTLGCLVAIILIGLPFAACTVREQVRRAEAIRKTWAAARMLGATDADLLGSNDDCGERGAWCVWTAIFTTRDSVQDFEDKINRLATQPIKKKEFDSGLVGVLLMRLGDAANGDDGAGRVNGYSGREVIDAQGKRHVQESGFFRWYPFPDGDRNGVSIDFFELRRVSDKFTFRGVALTDNVFRVEYAYRTSSQ